MSETQYGRQEFEAKSRYVFCLPKTRELGNGRVATTMGFKVAVADENVEGAAEQIAKALTLASMLEEKVRELRITCPEATTEDRVYEQAPEIMEAICDLIGYHKDEDEDDGETEDR